MNKGNTIIVLLILGLVVVAGCTSGGNAVAASGEQVTVYKSPNCGCCVGYIAELKRQGFNVEVVSMLDMRPIKQEHGIPMNVESCHTTVVGDYFIEGHVPIEAVNKLLEEKPDIDGIALPGMPAGSPGMPGVKRGPFIINSITDGQTSIFTTI